MQSINRFRMSLMASAVLALAGVSFIGPADAGALQQKTITIGGVQRTYYVSTPPNYPNRFRKYSVMFVLHGGSGTGPKVAQTSDMVAQADRLGFIAVFPNSNGGKPWNDGRSSTSMNGNDVAFLVAVSDLLVKEGSAAATRIFVAGVSNGGMMAQRLACDTNRFAAAAAMVANMPVDYVTLCHPPKRNMPMEFFMGTADPLMPYNGGATNGAAYGGAGGNVLSAQDTVALWSNYGGCTGEEVLPLQDRVNDGTHVIRHTSTGCRTGVQVIFHEIVGGGHCWPGSQTRATAATGICTENVNASDEIVHFFQAYGL